MEAREFYIGKPIYIVTDRVDVSELKIVTKYVKSINYGDNSNVLVLIVGDEPEGIEHKFTTSSVKVGLKESIMILDTYRHDENYLYTFNQLAANKLRELKIKGRDNCLKEKARKLEQIIEQKNKIESEISDLNSLY